MSVAFYKSTGGHVNVRILYTVVLGCLVISSHVRLRAQKPDGPPPGTLVDVGGHKMHIHCVGPVGAKPVVILEAGGGAYSKDWAKVQDLLSSKIRTCSYDRAGLGWSEQGPGPRTLHQEVLELHALLDTAKVVGPYVLVGHSLGGLAVRIYTEKYPDEVVGLVLAASTHENAKLGLVGKGWVRLRELATGASIPESQLKFPSNQSQNETPNYLAEEFQLIYLARKANPQTLGDRPLIVLLPTKIDSPPPGTSQDFWDELRLEKWDQTAGLVLLSSNSKLIRDPASGHNINVEDPQLVANAIHQIVDAVKTGKQLAPDTMIRK